MNVINYYFQTQSIKNRLAIKAFDIFKYSMITTINLNAARRASNLHIKSFIPTFSHEMLWKLIPIEKSRLYMLEKKSTYIFAQNAIQAQYYTLLHSQSVISPRYYDEFHTFIAYDMKLNSNAYYRAIILILVFPKYRLFVNNLTNDLIADNQCFENFVDFNDVIDLMYLIGTMKIRYKNLKFHLNQLYNSPELYKDIYNDLDYNKRNIYKRHIINAFDFLLSYLLVMKLFSNVLGFTKKGWNVAQLTHAINSSFAFILDQLETANADIESSLYKLLSKINEDYEYQNNLLRRKINELEQKSRAAINMIVNDNSLFFDIKHHVFNFNKPRLLDIPLLEEIAFAFWDLIVNVRHPRAKYMNKFKDYFKEHPNESNEELNLTSQPDAMLTIQIKIQDSDGRWKSLGRFNAFYWWEFHKWLTYILLFVVKSYQDYFASETYLRAIAISYKWLNDKDTILKFRARFKDRELVKPYISDINKFYNAIPHLWDLNEWKKLPGAVFVSIRNVPNICYLRDIPIYWNPIGNIDNNTPESRCNIEFEYIDEYRLATIFDNNSNILAKFVDKLKFKYFEDSLGNLIVYDVNNPNYNIVDLTLNYKLHHVEFERVFHDQTKLLIKDNVLLRIQAKDKSNETVFIKPIEPSSLAESNNILMGTFDLETRSYYTPEKYNLIPTLGNAVESEKSMVSSDAPPASVEDEVNINYELDKSGKPINHLQVVSISIAFREYYSMDQKFEGHWIARKFTIDDYLTNEQKLSTDPRAFLGAEQNMIRDFFDYIQYRSQNDTRNMYLFAHNSANFDLIFILKTLIDKLDRPDRDLSFLVRDNKFLSLNWKIPQLEINKEGKKSVVQRKNKKGVFEDQFNTVFFRDSYLILPLSLAKAAKQFGVPDKGSFDFNAINNVPYNVLESHLDKLAEYNMQDCWVLWHVLARYNKYLTQHFKVSIFDCPTAASIAFKTFRVNYLIQSKDQNNPDNHNIPVTSFDIYKELSQAYFGGACDVYKPTPPIDTPLYTYDINSEYPSMMASQLLPTGVYKHVIGDIDLTDTNLVAFVKCEVECPENILVPLLPVKINGKLVAGAGTWTGIYFSAEIREAILRGYKIKPIESWIFEGKIIFDKFINDLYNMRKTFAKSDPMNFICKQIMNSTYGRFGMAPYLRKVQILMKDGNNNYQDFTDFEDITQISDNKVMVTSRENANEQINIEGGYINICLPIAAAITSYGRICIHRIKWEAALNDALYYSDTDSVVTSKPLPDHMVGDELGMIKLEHVSESGVFLSPKVYALKSPRNHKGELIADYIIKAKGIKKDLIKYEDYVKLLNKTEVFRTFQEKWFRDIKSGSIRIYNLASMVRINEGKRVVVTDYNNTFYATQNIILKDGKIVSPLVVSMNPQFNRDQSIKLISPPNDFRFLPELEFMDTSNLISADNYQSEFMDSHIPAVIDNPEIINLPDKVYIDLYNLSNAEIIKLNDKILLSKDYSFMINDILQINNMDINEITILVDYIKYKKIKAKALTDLLLDSINNKNILINNNIILEKAKSEFKVILESELEIKNKIIKETQDKLAYADSRAALESARTKETLDKLAKMEQAKAAEMLEAKAKLAEMEAKMEAKAAEMEAKAALAKAEMEAKAALAKAEMEARIKALENLILNNLQPKVEVTKVENTKVDETLVEETIVEETKVVETKVDSISPKDISDFDDINDIIDVLISRDDGGDDDDEGEGGSSTPTSSDNSPLNDEEYESLASINQRRKEFMKSDKDHRLDAIADKIIESIKSTGGRPNAQHLMETFNTDLLPEIKSETITRKDIIELDVIDSTDVKDISLYDNSKYYEPIDKEIHDIIHAQVTDECRIKLAQMEKDSNVKDISLVDKSSDIDLPGNNLNKIISAMDQNPDILLTKDQMNYVLEQGSEKDPQGRKREVFMSTAFVEQDLAEGKEIKFREIMDYSEAELRELGRRIKEDEDGYREVGNELYIDMQRMDDLQVTVNRLNEYIQTINSRPKLDKKAKLALEHLTLIKKLLDNQIYTKEDAMKTTANHHLVGDIVTKQWDRETAIKALEIFRDTGRLPPTMTSERLESILGKPFEQLIEAPSDKSRTQAILAEVKADADARLLIEEASDKPQPYLKLPKTEISEFERHGFSLYINEGDPVEYMEIKSLFDFELQSTEDIIDTIDRIEKYIKDIPKLKGLNKQQRISKRESLTLILNLFKDEINRRGGDGGPQGGSPIPPITSDNTPEKSENIIKEVKIPELRSSKPKSTSKPKPKAKKAELITPPSIISIDNIDKITNKDIRNMLKSIDFTAQVNKIQDQIEKFFNLENCKLLQLDDLRDVITFLNTRGLDDQEKINCKIFKQFALTHLAKTRIKIVNSSTTKFTDGTILSDLPDSELLVLENVITPFYKNGEYDRCRKLLRVNDHVAAHLLEIYYRLKNTNICPNMQKVIASKLFELGAFNTKPDKGKFDP